MMMTLRCQNPLLMCVCALFSLPIAVNAFTESDILFEPNRQEFDNQISQEISALKPLQVVDCVLEKCLWLSHPRLKSLCTYLVCLGNPNKALLASKINTVLQQTIDQQDAYQKEPTSEIFPKKTTTHSKLRSLSRKELVRSKKWQYPDPLQHCVQTQCPGQRGVDFYTCVYKNCIAGKLTVSFMAV